MATLHSQGATLPACLQDKCGTAHVECLGKQVIDRWAVW